MAMKYLLKNGTLFNVAAREIKSVDILVNGSSIKEIAAGIKPDLDTLVIDIKNKIIAPGLIDVHVHFRQPGQEYKETIYSGSRAAAAGGFTAVIAEPNTIPPIDSASRIRNVLEIAKRDSIVKFYTKACISKEMKGEDLVDVESLKKAGAVAISDDGHPVPGSKLMENALKKGREFDILVSPHCEESDKYRNNEILKNGKQKQINMFSDWMPYSPTPGLPYNSETGFIKRDIELAEKTGARIHISHVSLATSVEEIALAKKRGVQITAEATPHHFILSDQDAKEIGTNAKVNPPLRTKKDISAIINGLIDGTIDVIATDHAPHSPEEKNKSWEFAPFGIIGLETALGLAITYLVKPGHLTIYQVIEKMSTNPYKIYGLSVPSITKGTQADITIIDPDLKWKVDVNEFYSKGRNCPFNGLILEGKAIMTIVNGHIVMNDGKIITSDTEH